MKDKIIEFENKRGNVVVFSLAIIAMIITVTVGTTVILIGEPSVNCQSCTEIRADINEMRRSLDNLGHSIQSNRDVSEIHDSHLADMGYPAYYKYVVEEE